MKVSHRFFVSFLFIYKYLLDIFSYHIRGSLDDAAGKKKGDKRIGTFSPSIFWANTEFAHTMHGRTFRTSEASILHFTATETLPHNKAEIFKIIMLP